MQRLFTPSLAKKYEEFYQENGVKFLKVSISFSLSLLCITCTTLQNLNSVLSSLLCLTINQGASIKNLEAGANGRVTSVRLADGSSIEADTVFMFV